MDHAVSLPKSDRIRTLAWWGQAMCAAGIAMSLGTLALALLHAGWRDHFMFGGMQLNGGRPLPLSETARQSIVLLMLPPVLCQSFALWTGWQLFKGYRDGEIFTESAAAV